MFGGIDKKPVAFEIWVLKWIFIPLCLLGLYAMFAGHWRGQHKCSSLCEEKGYFSSRYVPASKISAHRCYCLTAQESEITNRVPEGTRVF